MKNQAAVELGRLGGKKGGKARAKSLSPERRSEIARQAANTRWSKEEQEFDDEFIKKISKIKNIAKEVNK